MDVAFLFPGQGLQKPGMGKEFFEEDGFVKGLYQQASEAAQTDLADLCFNGSEERLNQTENTQPAVLVTSIAAYHSFMKKAREDSLDLRVAAAAGHSLGQYSALVAAKSIGFEDAVKLVHIRGKLMQTFSPEAYGMASIFGLTKGDVEEICKNTRTEISNCNSPSEIIISGKKEDLKLAVERAGGKSRILERIEIPFHSKWLKDAQTAFRAEIPRYALKDSPYPIISNVTAEGMVRGSQIKEDLIAQITAKVEWYKSMQKIINSGVNDFVAFGPAGALRIWMRDTGTANVYVVDSPASLEKTIYQLNNSLTARVA